MQVYKYSKKDDDTNLPKSMTEFMYVEPSLVCHRDKF